VSVSLYDLLDVGHDASAEEIRASWKASIADLDPSDRRFRAYNQAAEVLLDPDRRAAYDAELEADDDAAPEPAPAPVTTGGHAPAPAATAVAAPAGRPAAAGLRSRYDDLKRRLARPQAATAETSTAKAGWLVPVWLLVGLFVLTLVLAGSAVWLTHDQPSDASIERGLSTAEGVAQTAVPTIFSYDYRHLDEDHDKAARYLTEDYRTQTGGYDDVFDSVIKVNAPRLEAVVEAEFISSGIIRTGGGDLADDRVEVLVVFDQLKTNEQVPEPQRSPAYAVVTMEKVDGDWLVDDVTGPEVPQ
jgi:Mce-associated membrane protein